MSQTVGNDPFCEILKARILSPLLISNLVVNCPAKGQMW